jgi:geranylgeranyl diphosphate synthase type II
VPDILSHLSVPPRPMSSTTRAERTAQDAESHLGETLSRARAAIEQALASACPAEQGGDCPPRLAAAMRYATLGGGKRLRPVLTLLAAEACGGTWEQALPAACAVEMIHCYSLVHDDLPAMDDDDLRRGRPTCHKAFDEATAILAGDGLLTLAFEVVARGIAPGDRAARCVRILAAAAGPEGMVGGQMADLEAEDRPLAEGSAAALEAIHRRKTGALLTASLTLGAAAAGATEAEHAALSRYGRAVGLAFQIVDDLLDVQGDEAATGKRVGKDAGAGKWTYPAFLGIEESRRRARTLAEEAVADLETFGERGSLLRGLAWQLLERDR